MTNASTSPFTRSAARVSLLGSSTKRFSAAGSVGRPLAEGPSHCTAGGPVYCRHTGRVDPRDVLVGPEGTSTTLASLKEGAIVGTSSLRRVALLNAYRRGRDTTDHPWQRRYETAQARRWTIRRHHLGGGRAHPPRARRAGERVAGANVLAARRPGQGALGIVTRTEDAETRQLVAALNDPDSFRGGIGGAHLSRSLGGGCQVPIGALGVPYHAKLRLWGWWRVPTEGVSCGATSPEAWPIPGARPDAGGPASGARGRDDPGGFARMTLPTGPRVLSRETLLARFGRPRERTVVFTNGLFDLLHPGHVRVPRPGEDLGDVLVVGLNSDASVRRLKGAGRPLVTEADRAAVLAALRSVDAVTLFDEDTPLELISALLPMCSSREVITIWTASSAGCGRKSRRRCSGAPPSWRATQPQTSLTRLKETK